MQFRKLRKWLVMGALPSMAVALALPATAASVSAARPSGAPRTAAKVAAPSKTVIIFLRDESSGLAPRSAGRLAAVRAEQAPILSQLRASGGHVIATTNVLDTVTAKVSPAEAAALAANPVVKQVLADGVIVGPARPVAPTGFTTGGRATKRTVTPGPCGTAASPESDPEALTNIHAVPGTLASGVDGAGVTVAFLADGVETTNPDFQRNAAYASASSPAGSPVISQYQDFSGDGTLSPTAGGEAFLDASSIAAQGNTAYDLNNFVNSAHPVGAGCDIKITGAAPGANVMALKIFGQNNDTTASGFVQAIDYAVANGAKVINESFGSNNFPDTTLDVIRNADDAAEAAGVTVVVSSGDAGISSTIGSPSSDPNVISVGATTTFRSYRQVTYGGINDPHTTGYVDDNISSLSSGGYTQAGNTVDLVAPGDLNWALCDANTALYADCTNESGAASPIELSGGTSESSPLTAAAAADVIQAYATTHGGADPSPAVVKQVLVSTATDIFAPADQQGAGLLDVQAAVKEAQSLPGTTATPSGGLLVSPTQVNVVQQPGASTTQTIHITNTGSGSTTVALSTRALTHEVASQSSSFCMQPGTASASCPANTGSFPIWSGVTEVYEDQSFTVPANTTPSRLVFTADYQYTGQSSLLHFALIEPDGTYAGYSLPQGLGDFGDVEVADPPAGTWTAVFFTEKNGVTAGGVGTSGTVQWNATTLDFAPAGSVSTSSVTLAPGQTSTVQLVVKSPASPGDTDQSIVLSRFGGQTTLPVTVRTVVPPSGNFSGVLTGGNGRAGAPAETNTYYFNVPPGQNDVEASVALASDPADTLVGMLVDPSGQTVGYSSNYTTDNFGKAFSTPYVSVYHVNPEPGMWRLVLDWANPVTGNELAEPFTGSVRFDQVSSSSNLPHGPFAELTPGQTYKYTVRIDNTGVAPESFFADPRLDQSVSVPLPDQNGSATNMTLPLPPGLSFPYYFVPTETSQLHAGLTGSAPVTFDLEYFPGDPDVSPAVRAPGVSGSQGGNSASLTLSEPEVSPGLWLLNPDEIGPYPASGAPSATASATLAAVTKAFDPAVQSSTGDFWQAANGLGTQGFSPTYVPAGGSANLTIDLTPSAAPGSHVSGTLYVDDYALGSYGPALPNADELAAIPYSYRVASSSEGYWMTSKDGGVYHFGAGKYYGSAVGLPLRGPIVGIAASPDHGGYWLVGSDGGVFTFGDAKYRGSLARLPLPAPIVGMTSDASGLGYWLVGSEGHVYPFGDATNFGSEDWTVLHEHVVGIAATSDGLGYWLVTDDGHVLPFGDAVQHGSPATSGLHLTAPLVGITTTPDGNGYWLVASDGGVFRYGDAKFYGSLGGQHLNAPAVAIAATPDGKGYWIFTADGGVFRFGDAQYLGSETGKLRSALSGGSSANS